MESTAANEPAPAPAPAAPATEPPRPSARTAALWSLAGYGGSQGLRLVSNLVLTRLLLSEHFGLMALVAVLFQGLQLFSDVGIGPAIIQSKRGDDPNWLNTAWTIQVARGFALALIACACAIPFASFYGQAALALLVPASAVSAAISGFRSTKTFTVARDLVLGRTVLIELGSQLVGMVATIVWALYDRTVWALVGGSLVRVVVQTAAGHFMLPGVDNRFRWDPEAARALFSFGRWVFVSTALMFVAGQADRLIFGKLVSMADLGVYSIALLLAGAPSAALGQLNSQIVFPLYSRAHRSGDDLGPMYARARWPMLVMGGWGVSAMIASGPSLVRVLYGSEYWDAGWMIQVAAIGIWFGIVLEGTNGAALLAQGLARWTAAGSLGKVLGICMFMPLGYMAAGFPGALWALAASEFCRYLVSTYAARRRGLFGLRQDLGTTVLIAGSALAAMFVAEKVHGGLGLAPVEALAAVAVVSAAWAPVALPLVRGRLLKGARP